MLSQKLLFQLKIQIDFSCSADKKFIAIASERHQWFVDQLNQERVKFYLFQSFENPIVTWSSIWCATTVLTIKTANCGEQEWLSEQIVSKSIRYVGTKSQL